MWIQCFLIIDDICHISFRDMGYFSKYLKGYGILGTPIQGLSIGNVITTVLLTESVYM